MGTIEFVAPEDEKGLYQGCAYMDRVIAKQSLWGLIRLRGQARGRVAEREAHPWMSIPCPRCQAPRGYMCDGRENIPHVERMRRV